MSSGQINFYVMPQDIIEIRNILKEKSCLILRGKVETLEQDLNYDIGLNNENIFQTYICNEEFGKKIFFEEIKGRGYDIDMVKSYVIEFGMGGFYPYSQKELHRSRFYYIYEYFEKNELIIKNESFTNWANDIFKTIKKRLLKRVPEYGNNFFSEQCISWVKDNNAKSMLGGQKFVIDQAFD